MDPIGIIYSQIAFLTIRVKGPLDLKRQHINTYGFDVSGDIQVDDPERAYDLVRISNQLAVDPQIRLVIDAMQF